MKIRPVGAEMLHVDRTDGNKPTVAFRDFANAPKIPLLPIAIRSRPVRLQARQVG